MLKDSAVRVSNVESALNVLQDFDTFLVLNHVSSRVQSEFRSALNRMWVLPPTTMNWAERSASTSSTSDSWGGNADNDDIDEDVHFQPRPSRARVILMKGWTQSSSATDAATGAPDEASVPAAAAAASTPQTRLATRTFEIGPLYDLAVAPDAEFTDLAGSRTTTKMEKQRFGKDQVLSGVSERLNVSTQLHVRTLNGANPTPITDIAIDRNEDSLCTALNRTTEKVLEHYYSVFGAMMKESDLHPIVQALAQILSNALGADVRFIDVDKKSADRKVPKFYVECPNGTLVVGKGDSVGICNLSPSIESPELPQADEFAATTAAPMATAATTMTTAVSEPIDVHPTEGAVDGRVTPVETFETAAGDVGGRDTPVLGAVAGDSGETPRTVDVGACALECKTHIEGSGPHAQCGYETIFINGRNCYPPTFKMDEIECVSAFLCSGIVINGLVASVMDPVGYARDGCGNVSADRQFLFFVEASGGTPEDGAFHLFARQLKRWSIRRRTIEGAGQFIVSSKPTMGGLGEGGASGDGPADGSVDDDAGGDETTGGDAASAPDGGGGGVNAPVGEHSTHARHAGVHGHSALSSDTRGSPDARGSAPVTEATPDGSDSRHASKPPTIVVSGFCRPVVRRIDVDASIRTWAASVPRDAVEPQ